MIGAVSDAAPDPVSVTTAEPCLTLVWDRATEAQWRQWMVQAGRSNLLQSWAYGEAKAASSGWRVTRGVFYLADEPIAVVAVLRQRKGGLIEVSRINRGPLALRPLLAAEQRAVWRALGGLGNVWRGRVLSAAPELEHSESAQTMMAWAGFRQFLPRAWESMWIDLGLELDVLRRGMTGKWRRWVKDLDQPARKGIALEANSDAAAFDWMIGRYEELLQANGFSGPSVRLVRSLRTALGDEEPLLVVRAIHQGEPVSGICLALHGVAATYLLGWNGPMGRSLNANRFLFWFAIKLLKQSGLRWFDLGGIDEKSTPGITAFKVGLGGERYALVGEHVKW